MAKSSEKIEREGFHNQTLTEAARQARQTGPERKPARRVVALQLDAREQAALDHLGGPDALKRLLCPAGICICCREMPSVAGTRFDSYCGRCAESSG